MVSPKGCSIYKCGVGGGGEEEERKVFGRGEETNSELFYPIRLYMISGRRGDVEFLIIFRSSRPSHHTFKWKGPKTILAFPRMVSTCL